MSKLSNMALKRMLWAVTLYLVSVIAEASECPSSYPVERSENPKWCMANDCDLPFDCKSISAGEIHVDKSTGLILQDCFFCVDEVAKEDEEDTTGEENITDEDEEEEDEEEEEETSAEDSALDEDEEEEEDTEGDERRLLGNLRRGNDRELKKKKCKKKKKKEGHPDCLETDSNKKSKKKEKKKKTKKRKCGKKKKKKNHPDCLSFAPTASPIESNPVNLECPDDFPILRQETIISGKKKLVCAKSCEWNYVRCRKQNELPLRVRGDYILERCPYCGQQYTPSEGCPESHPFEISENHCSIKDCSLDPVDMTTCEIKSEVDTDVIEFVASPDLKLSNCEVCLKNKENHF